MTDQRLAFYYENGPVGCFQTDAYPRQPGVYPYMPYRSGSHYFMHQKLRESGCVECSYVTEEGRVRFKVIGCPGYGRLELSDFGIVSSGA